MRSRRVSRTLGPLLGLSTFICLYHLSCYNCFCNFVSHSGHTRCMAVPVFISCDQAFTKKTCCVSCGMMGFRNAMPYATIMHHALGPALPPALAFRLDLHCSRPSGTCCTLCLSPGAWRSSFYLTNSRRNALEATAYNSSPFNLLSRGCEHGEWPRMQRPRALPLRNSRMGCRLSQQGSLRRARRPESWCVARQVVLYTPLTRGDRSLWYSLFSPSSRS